MTGERTEDCMINNPAQIVTKWQFWRLWHSLHQYCLALHEPAKCVGHEGAVIAHERGKHIFAAGSTTVHCFASIASNRPLPVILLRTGTCIQ